MTSAVLLHFISMILIAFRFTSRNPIVFLFVVFFFSVRRHAAFVSSYFECNDAKDVETLCLVRLPFRFAYFCFLLTHFVCLIDRHNIWLNYLVSMHQVSVFLWSIFFTSSICWCWSERTFYYQLRLLCKLLLLTCWSKNRSNEIACSQTKLQSANLRKLTISFGWQFFLYCVRALTSNDDEAIKMTTNGKHSICRQMIFLCRLHQSEPKNRNQFWHILWSIVLSN